MQDDYALIDSGHGRKLEKFGPYIIDRPCAQAVWGPQLAKEVWSSKADALFTREPDNRWVKKKNLPESWNCSINGIIFKIAPTDFGHLGIFPEQKPFWKWIQGAVSDRASSTKVNVLNLFAYSGGATFAASKGGAHVCHLDASKAIVSWARENAALNNLAHAPIRWIIDDVSKFLMRELRRGMRYDAIVLDPPSFGRGSQGEVFKIEEEIVSLLAHCRSLLSDHPLFLFFSCHTPGFTPVAMGHLLSQAMHGVKGSIITGEMLLEGESALSIPSGTFARWVHG